MRAAVLAGLLAVVVSACGDAFRTTAREEAAVEEVPEPESVLSMETLRRCDMALRNVALAAVANPAFGAAIRTRAGETPTMTAARLDTIPELRDAIGRAGLSVTEYLVINNTLYRALNAWYGLQEGRIATIPDGVNPADVRFVQQNDMAIREMVQRSQAQLAPLLPDSLRQQILE